MNKFILLTIVNSQKQIGIRIDDVKKIEESSIEIESEKYSCTKIITDEDRDYWTKVSEPIEEIINMINE